MTPLDWEKLDGLLPAIIQDARTKQVLMLGYMNCAAFSKTLKTKRVWFYSRSKKRLWMKGETSGNILYYKNSAFDCDSDAILVQAIPKGPTCHKETASCFGEVTSGEEVFDELFNIIKRRKCEMPKKSYTAYLFKKGIPKICAKIKEEAAETVKSIKQESKRRLTEESADLLYHLFVALVARGVGLGKIREELSKRFGKKRIH
jgi:phosphoribosyl-ATP pyrophosphohydrolase/phosphoribosyl-AMP cyclohydrolase